MGYNIMATIKKSKLREVLTNKGLSEGFLGKFFDRLNKDLASKALAKKIEKNEKDKAELQKQYDAKTKEIEAILVKKYGSVNKIPAIMKKKFKLN